MTNGIMKTHGMKSAFLRIRQHAFHVFQCTGDSCLTVSFHHRHVDHIVHFRGTTTNMKFQSSTIHGYCRFLLSIDQLYLIFLCQFVIATDFKGFLCLISHPGALHDRQILKSICLQIPDQSLHHFRVGGSAFGCQHRCHQIRLDTDPSVPVTNQLRKPCLTEQLFGHIYIVSSIGHQDLIFLHHSSSIIFPSSSISMIHTLRPSTLISPIF